MSESQVTTIARQFIEQADPRALLAELLSIIDQLPQANAIMIEHEVITAEEIFAACEVAKTRPLTRSDAQQKKEMSILNPSRPIAIRIPQDDLQQIDEQAAALKLTRTAFIVASATGSLTINTSSLTDRIDYLEEAVKRLQEFAFGS